MTRTEGAAAAAARFKDFPPGWDHLKVPLSSRRAALAGLGLYAPCTLTGVLAQRAAWMCVRVLGPRSLPGRDFAWEPTGADAWPELAGRWRRELGDFDEVAGYARAQADRSGCALLLLRRGRPVAFVKLRREHSGHLHDEERALRAMWRFGPRTFRVPEPLGLGASHGWHYLAVVPMPAGLHRAPVAPPLRAILDEIEVGLAAVPRPAGTPGHWRPMHGDFAPWNLRRTSRDTLFLIDWENASWGPPGADEVFYRATTAALNGRPSHAPVEGEAIQFWLGRLSEREGAGARDRRLARAQRTILERLGAKQDVGTEGGRGRE